MHENLLSLYQPDGDERVGLIMADGSLTEVANIHQMPSEHFDVSAEDLIKYCEGAIGTFHTHPGRTNNLSVNDQQAFLAWPHLTHYIVGSDGVQAYVVEGHIVVKNAA